MGFAELKQKIQEKIREQQLKYEEGQARAEARDDWETTDKGLRNKRREVRKYIDQDEKAQLEAYIRQRRAQEDSSWMNPYGMLDNQEINISRPQPRIFETGFNPHRMQRGGETNILMTPNPFVNTKQFGGVNNGNVKKQTKPKNKRTKKKK